MSQNVADAAELVSPNFSAVSLLVEALQAPVTEALDQKKTVTCNVARCKKQAPNEVPAASSPW